MTDSTNVNQEFYDKTEKAFHALFEAARNKHELHFAMALIPEMRGMQDAGWNTAAEAHHAFDEYLEFLEKQEQSRMKCRVALGFYCHIAEASGFYEIPKNMLRIAEGKGHMLSPFIDLVQAHKQTGDQIAPNANSGSRYFCESFYGHPCPTSGKNYATAYAFGGPSRPASLVAYPTRGMQHRYRNDSTRFRKACIFTTHKALRENTCPIASGDYSTPVSQRRFSRT